MQKRLQKIEQQVKKFQALLKSNRGGSRYTDGSYATSSEGEGRSLQVRERPGKRHQHQSGSGTSSPKRHRLDDDSFEIESAPDGELSCEGEPAMAQPITEPAMALPANEESEMTQTVNSTVLGPNKDNFSLSKEEVIQVFGKLLHEERGTAPNVLPELAIRWEEILLKGIPSDTINEMLTKYPPPKNCPRFDPPKLNQVLKAIMPEQVCERDDRISKRQLKISAALSAMGKTLSTIAVNKNIPEWKSLVENISDASKILADLQHDESVIRRNLLMANIESSMKEPLKNTEVGEFLFGTGLEETVKNIKAMKTTARDLKKAVNRPEVSKNPKAPQRQMKARRKHSASARSGTRKQTYSASKIRTKKNYREKSRH
ncbi:hypothetical protein DMENIID0001_027140 [Sergentomyia squamirostris]